MEIQAPNRKIPERLREESVRLQSEGLVALYTKKYPEAAKHFQELYTLLFQAQEEEDRPIHKGLPLHNQGIALFALGKTDEAIRNILLAYVEDTLNAGYDLEDNADRGPAAQTLRDVLYFRLRILKEIKAIAAEIKASGRWSAARDPEPILTEAARRLEFDTNRLSEQCEREVPREAKISLGFPQPRERRVFVGTNYLVNPGVIPIAKEAIVRHGYVPVVAVEVIMRPNATHDDTLLLLHTCGYAIIDITHPGGQFMEIERAKDYGVQVLLVHQAIDPSNPPPLSAMIATTRYRIEYYDDPRDLLQIIPKFLP